MVPVDEKETESRARAAWANDPKVRAEFLSIESYIAFEKADARGRIKILSGRGVITASRSDKGTAPARLDGDQADPEARQVWESNPAIRAEFISFEDFQAFRRAERAGRFKVLGVPRQRQASTVSNPSPAPTRQVMAPITEHTKLAPSQPDISKEKEKGIGVALANLALSIPETFAALIAEDRNPAAPVPTGKLDVHFIATNDDMTLAEFKQKYPDIAAAVVAADRKTRGRE